MGYFHFGKEPHRRALNQAADQGNARVYSFHCGAAVTAATKTACYDPLAYVRGGEAS